MRKNEKYFICFVGHGIMNSEYKDFVRAGRFEITNPDNTSGFTDDEIHILTKDKSVFEFINKWEWGYISKEQLEELREGCKKYQENWKK